MQMKPRPSSSLVAAAVLATLFVVQSITCEPEASAASIERPQAASHKNVVKRQTRPQSATTGAIASSAASMASVSSSSGSTRHKLNNSEPDEVSSGREPDESGVDAPVEPPRRSSSAPRRKPQAPPPSRHRPQTHRTAYEPEEDDEDCNGAYDNEYPPEREYRNLFNMATRPMRQIQSMMGNMFAQMPSAMMAPVDSDDEESGGGQWASASASSSYDGDQSRSTSLVSNNGRTRGLVSVTRNGRTQTRRIGSRKDWDEEE